MYFLFIVYVFMDFYIQEPKDSPGAGAVFAGPAWPGLGFRAPGACNLQGLGLVSGGRMELRVPCLGFRL